MEGAIALKLHLYNFLVFVFVICDGVLLVLIKKMSQFEIGVDHLVNSLALLPVLPLVWFLRFCN